MATRSDLAPAEEDVLVHLLDEAFDALERDELDHVRACAHEATELAADDPEVLYLGAQLAWIDKGLSPARSLLERAVGAAPEYADARHALARVLEALEERKAMTEHDLEVLRLDTEADARAGVGLREDLDFIEAEAERTIAALPQEFRDRLQGVPIVLEARPARGVVAEGFDPRALGLFEGPEDGDLRSDEVAVQPTRIVLFYANLLAAFEDDAVLVEQIEVTLLHELGHFFGLDEEQVARLGLE